MRTTGHYKNNKIRRFELGDMLPGEVFYLVNDPFVACKISEHGYKLKRGERITEEKIEFWYWYNSVNHGQRRIYHRTAAVIPADINKVLNRCLRDQRKKRKAKI